MQPITPARARYGSFCAIDFETANPRRTSACAMAVVRVERNRVVDEWSTLIQPPDGYFHPRFSGIHGIRPQDVRDAPTFPEAWKEARGRMRQARFLAAHNASFDASVMQACTAYHDLPTPSLPFLCTVRLARAAWNIRPTRLPNVTEALGIDLEHHEAKSDARACARIVTTWRRDNSTTRKQRQEAMT